jgi:PAS domain S-box-containing protein
MRLAVKFSIIFVLLSIFSISVMGYLSYREGRNRIINDKYKDLTSANDYLQTSFERWVTESVRTLEITAKAPFFRNDFEKMMAAHDPADTTHMAHHRDMVNTRLSPLVEAKEFREVFILRSDDGLVTFSTDKIQEEKQMAGQPFFTHGRNRSYVQNVYYSMSLQQAAMTIATPIRNLDGSIVAVLGAHLNLAALSDMVEKGRHIRPTQDTYLVNKFNYFITEPRFGKAYALKKAVHTQGVQRALAGNDGIGLYEDYRKIPVIGAYRWVPERELCLISEIDQKEALGPIYQLRKAIILVCLVAAVFAALAGWLTAQTITRPLSKLIRDTEKIGKGELDFTVREARKDEVGELSRAFERMTNDLKETLVSRDELVQEVAERIRAQEQTLNEKHFSETLVNSLPGVFYLFDKASLRFQRWNDNLEKVTGYSATEISGMSPLDLFDELDRPRVAQRIGEVFEAGHSDVEANFLTKDGRQIPFYFTGLKLTIGKIDYLAGTGIDITQRIQMEAERERLIAGLQKALDEVKKLHGLLPICASCKNIRDDKGYWNQIEVYIGERSEAEFSHSICPECAQKLYPDLGIQES